MIGNFIADHIKGNQFKHYNEEIQKGIFLHREIDTFTDAHEIVRISKRRLHERYRHYDGVIIDIFYDHFLAKNWANYSKIPLQDFANNVYNLLQENWEILPLKSQNFIKYMIEHNMLFNYQYENGIEMVLKGMNHRTKGKSQMDLAIHDLQLYNQDFENDFLIFFEDLKLYSSNFTKNYSTL